jgi:hypothetical protein
MLFCFVRLLSICIIYPTARSHTHTHTHAHTTQPMLPLAHSLLRLYMYVTGTSIVPNKTSENRGVFFLLLSRNIRIQKRLVQFKKAYIYIILIHDSYYNVHFINSFFFIISHFLKVFAFEGWLFKKFGMQIYTFFLVKVIKK